MSRKQQQTVDSELKGFFEATFEAVFVKHGQIPNVALLEGLATEAAEYVVSYDDFIAAETVRQTTSTKRSHNKKAA